LTITLDKNARQGYNNNLSGGRKKIYNFCGWDLSQHRATQLADEKVPWAGTNTLEVWKPPSESCQLADSGGVEPQDSEAARI